MYYLNLLVRLFDWTVDVWHWLLTGQRPAKVAEPPHDLMYAAHVQAEPARAVGRVVMDVRYVTRERVDLVKHKLPNLVRPFVRMAQGMQTAPAAPAQAEAPTDELGLPRDWRPNGGEVHHSIYDMTMEAWQRLGRAGALNATGV